MGKFAPVLNNGLKTCAGCGKVTHKGAGYGSYCSECSYLQSLENEHEDGDHNHQPNTDCPSCVAAAEAGE